MVQVKNKFIEAIENYQKNIEESLSTGCISEKLIAQEKELQLQESEILENLIPFFQDLDSQKKKVRLVDSPINEDISKKEDSRYIQNILNLLNDIYLVEDINGAVHIIKRKKQTYQWCGKLNTYIENSNIRFICKKTKDSVLVVTQETIFEMKVIWSEEKDKIESFIIDYYTLTEEINYLYGMLSEQVYLVDQQGLSLLYLGESISTQKVKDIDNDGITNVTCLKDTILIAFEAGHVDTYQYSSGKLEYTKRYKCSRQEILGSLTLDSNQVLFFDSHSMIAIVDLQLEEIVLTEKIDGVPFVSASNGTVAILSTDKGIAVLLEKIFFEWCINPYIRIEESYYEGMTSIDNKTFIAFDLDHRIHQIETERITSVDDLLNVELY